MIHLPFVGRRELGRRLLAAAAGILLLLPAGCTSPAPPAPVAPSTAPARPMVPPPILEQDPSSSSANDSTSPAADLSLTTGLMTVDPGTAQQAVTGLGVDANVHSWKGGQLKPAIDRYTALGPMTWRVIIEKADWEPAQVGRANVIDPAYQRSIYETPKMQDLWNTIAYIEASPGQTVSLSVMGGVPDWMGGSQILPDKEDYWVRMIASLLDYGRNQKHLRLNLISPVNEGDYNGIEGPRVPPNQMTGLLDKLGHRLDALGMPDVRFVVPDTSSPVAARDQYLPALLSDPVVADRIARVGIHSYDGDAGSVPQLVAASRQASAGVWATEFNAPCNGCDTGTEPADSWDHALSMARDFLSLIDQGVNGAQLYDAWDGYYEHHGAVGYWGALKYNQDDGTYTPRRSFDVLALLLRAIPPGSVHVASSGASAVDSEAFTVPGNSVAIVGANPTGSTQRFRVQVSGAEDLSRPSLSIVSSASGLSAGALPIVQGDSLIVTVPADAVFAVSAAR